MRINVPAAEKIGEAYSSAQFHLGELVIRARAAIGLEHDQSDFDPEHVGERAMPYAIGTLATTAALTVLKINGAI